VYIHLPQPALTAIDEFVGPICWGNDNLPCPRLERRGANRIRSHALLENKDFLIRMLMQPNLLSWLHINQNKGNVGVSMPVSFKLRRVLRVLKFILIDNDVVHMRLLSSYLQASLTSYSSQQVARQKEPLLVRRT
jgi:hypothetical protein